MYSSQPKVLVVDDDPYELELMRTYLDPVAEVTTALGGQRALECVQQQPVDMIFLDVNMPVMNGFKTLEQLRNLKECINVPVVFVTGQNDRYSVMNSLYMGSDGYLLKPVKKEILQQKVHELCQKKDSEENRKTILAIDDDMAYLKTINNYLRSTYNVVIINSAKLALDYLMKHTPDLILLDYQMPLYNGASFLNMLNRKPDGNPIPVIVLSGTIDRAALKEFSTSNPDCFLVKPVSKEILLENIDRLLYGSNQEA
ncbi:MAG: response regulator [Lachnospiraceae bacterium]|nr:response regulator [Lachnospiraceae bacterium]